MAAGYMRLKDYTKSLSCFTVCPAGWKPGSDSIKPDVQKSKEFFSKQ